LSLPWPSTESGDAVERLLIVGAYDRHGSEHIETAGGLTRAIAGNHSTIIKLLIEQRTELVFEEQPITMRGAALLATRLWKREAIEVIWNAFSTLTLFAGDRHTY
jgi:hypothetical protein